LAGVVALNNSLNFAEENFGKPNERDMIMRTICESTQCTDVKVREKAFECIARVADLYYDKLTPYVDTLFQLTTQAIKTDDPSVGMQAIEFWSTVCDCETSVLEDIADRVENAPTYLKLVQQAAPLVVPIMLDTLSKQIEDSEGDDNWSIAMAGNILHAT
jgi:importin subunit beta-1